MHNSKNNPLAPLMMMSSTFAIAMTLVSCKGSEAPERIHYDNPFAETSKWYVNPIWAANARADGGEAIADQSSAVWFTHTSDVKAYDGKEPKNGMGLREHLDAALEQQADLFTFTMYNLPSKGCSTSFGNITPMDYRPYIEFQANQENMNTYKKHFVDEIVSIVSEDKYAGISIVAIIEPDTLALQVEHSQQEACQNTANDKPWSYTEGIRYALTRFKEVENIHSYVAAGSAAHLGWPEALELSSLYMKGVISGFDGLKDVAQTIGTEFEKGDGGSGRYSDIGEVFVLSAGETPAPGWDSINGFITNTANYVPLEEPHLEDIEPLENYELAPRTAYFYDWNPVFGELEYTKEWLEAMRSHGADESHGMLIDTSRNGWGGNDRPSLDPEAEYIDMNEQVNALRIDRREHRRNHCNQEGAGIGERPQANPERYIDAYIWAKPPGESDGISERDFIPDPNYPIRKHVEICDPLGQNEFAESVESTADLDLGTSAMAGAPRYGEWFSYAFKQLLENAEPPIE